MDWTPFARRHHHPPLPGCAVLQPISALHPDIVPLCGYLLKRLSRRKTSLLDEKKHLLWSLNLMKTADTEHCMAGRWRADEKTIRKWTFIFIETLSSLQVVSCLCFYLCFIALSHFHFILSFSLSICFIMVIFRPSNIFGRRTFFDGSR
jgi:hypothetical protein